MNVAELLEKQANKTPHKPAIIFKDQTISFNQLRDSSFKFADSLIKLGIKKETGLLFTFLTVRSIYSVI